MASPALEQLTLVRCDEEQIKQGLRNHWPKWGKPRGFTEERYVQRGLRLRDNQSFSRNGAHVTWGLVQRSDPSKLLAHCETFKRQAIALAPGESEPKDVVAYTIAAVFCPEENRGKGYARQMLKLLHYALGDPSGLPPWPEAWGAPPAEPLGDARFSVLYSGIGDTFYPTCRIGDGPSSREGWIEHPQDTRIWTIQTTQGSEYNYGLWEWLGRSDTVKLEEELAQRFREDLPKQGDPKKTRVAILPGGMMDYQIWRFLEMFPDFASPRFGCLLPPDKNGRRPLFTYTAVAKGPEQPQTLEIMHIQQPVPWAAIRAAAVHHGADKIKIWTDFEGWDKEEGGVKVEKNEDCPSIAEYGLGDVDWQFNDKYAWS